MENKVHAIQMTAGPDLDQLSVDTAGAGAFGARTSWDNQGGRGWAQK